jgi:hypothetical protein
MTNFNILVRVKILHTLIWIFFNLVLFYMAFSVIVNRIDKFVWIGMGCIVIEWIVLLSFKWQCPFTLIARKYTDSTKENFDIYIPNWLAKYNKEIYITFFIIVISGLIFRILNK